MSLHILESSGVMGNGVGAECAGGSQYLQVRGGAEVVC